MVSADILSRLGLQFPLEISSVKNDFYFTSKMKLK